MVTKLQNEEQKVEKQKVLLVFLRECETSKHKVGLMLLHITKEEWDEKLDVEPNDERVYIYEKGKRGSYFVGNAYEFDAEVDERGKPTAIYFGSKTYLGRWHDREQVLEWESEHKAYSIYREAKALEKKESGSLIKEILAPIRERYQKLPYSRKEAFLAAIIYEVTK